MSKSAEYLDLPFEEAIEFFRRKLNVPTARWTDLWHEMHARAFSVAGAMEEELLEDLRTAIDRAISEGTTLDEFREAFDGIIKRTGWGYKGGYGWRTAIIFNTNLNVAYEMGHYRQMMDPDVIKARPYFRYVGSSSREKRPEHMQWYNLVLPADDPFWDTHYPPNGWGCKCGIVSHSAREVERIGNEEANGSHPIRTQAPAVETFEWVDKSTGTVRRIPKGIDPGWDYHVGKAGFRE